MDCQMTIHCVEKMSKAKAQKKLQTNQSVKKIPLHHCTFGALNIQQFFEPLKIRCDGNSPDFQRVALT